MSKNQRFTEKKKKDDANSEMEIYSPFDSNNKKKKKEERVIL